MKVMYIDVLQELTGIWDSFPMLESEVDKTLIALAHSGHTIRLITVDKDHDYRMSCESVLSCVKQSEEQQKDVYEDSPENYEHNWQYLNNQ